MSLAQITKFIIHYKIKDLMNLVNDNEKQILTDLLSHYHIDIGDINPNLRKCKSCGEYKELDKFISESKINHHTNEEYILTGHTCKDCNKRRVIFNMFKNSLSDVIPRKDQYMKRIDHLDKLCNSKLFDSCENCKYIKEDYVNSMHIFVCSCDCWKKNLWNDISLICDFYSAQHFKFSTSDYEDIFIDRHITDIYIELMLYLKKVKSKFLNIKKQTK